MRRASPAGVGEQVHPARDGPQVVVGVHEVQRAAPGQLGRGPAEHAVDLRVRVDDDGRLVLAQGDQPRPDVLVLERADAVEIGDDEHDDVVPVAGVDEVQPRGPVRLRPREEAAVGDALGEQAVPRVDDVGMVLGQGELDRRGRPVDGAKPGGAQRLRQVDEQPGGPDGADEGVRVPRDRRLEHRVAVGGFNPGLGHDRTSARGRRSQGITRRRGG
ncbi:hypothetical protein ACPPVO_16290 [Dactylosporangium sp. McL0621]|uniref:hypothetical protein n=1 Tax=Dactylosporangium sp. McL0621 TaxID=3415678 RepID=UPI003CEC3B4A